MSREQLQDGLTAWAQRAGVQLPRSGGKACATHAVRHAVARRDGWACHYCGGMTVCHRCLGVPPAHTTTRAVRQPLAATVDHVIPRSRGGTHSLGNLVIACVPCNSAKGDWVLPS